jgi:hypothetical protein
MTFPAIWLVKKRATSSLCFFAKQLFKLKFTMEKLMSNQNKDNHDHLHHPQLADFLLQTCLQFKGYNYNKMIVRPYWLLLSMHINHESVMTIVRL